MTDEEKALLEAWDERSIHHCEIVGGYPDDTAIVGGHLVVASVDGDEPHLLIVPIDEALSKFGAAKEALARGEYETLDEAMYEEGL